MTLESMAAECPFCGPHYGQGNGYLPVCPTCGMDAGEARYVLLIERLGGAEVYRREWRAAHGLAVTDEGAA